MSDLYWLTNEQMAKLAPFFSNSHGKPRVGDRRVLHGVPIGAYWDPEITSKMQRLHMLATRVAGVSVRSRSTAIAAAVAKGAE